MKKQLTVALGLAVLATPVFASKARLQALGDDVNGSFYINDNRNVFLNAAQVNNHKDLVTYEWGDTTNGTDSSAAPRSEGGVFRAHNNMVWGLYLGSESNTSNGFRQAAVGAAVAEENNVDLFVAGDAGVKWGANVTYSKSDKDETDQDSEASALRTRFGVIAGDVEGWANINVSNKAEKNDVEFKGKLGFQIGGVYHMNDYNIFADYRKFDGESEGGAADFDLKSSQIQVGAGRVNKLNDKASLFTKVSFVKVDAENEGTTNDLGAGGCSATAVVACEEYKSTNLPVVIGLEYDAASWLVLRTSVGQSLLVAKEEGNDSKRGLQETTRVNAGATLKFGELNVDGVVGNGAAAAAGSETNTGELNTDTIMTRVSMTYRF